MKHRVYSEHQGYEPTVHDQNALGLVIKAIGEREGVTFGEISVVVMPDDVHTGLNIKYLGHDYSTDILTFDLTESEVIDGDIYINWEVCVNNGQEYEVTPKEELYRLFVHGLLHLVGMDDGTDEEKKEMRAAEDRYLQLISENGFM